MGREGDAVRVDGERTVLDAAPADLTLQSVKTKVRIGSRDGRHSSRRSARVAAALALLVLGLGAAALGAPMLQPSASASEKPELAVGTPIPSTTSDTAQPTDDGVAPGSMSPAAATPSMATWAPESDWPMPVTGGTSAGNGGRDPSWYQSLKDTNEQAISAGESGSLSVANLGRSQCEGMFHLTAYDIHQVLFALDYRTDPEVMVYTAPVMWPGTFDLQLTCFSSGFNSGSSHTWHMPVTVGPAKPWLINVTMSNTTSMPGVLNSLYASYTIDSHEASNSNEGTCTFTATLSDGGTIGLDHGGTLTAAGTSFFWVGGRAGELDLFIPPDSGPGTVTWKLACTDLGGVGYGATASASGTYSLRRASTNPPTEAQTNPPGPTPPGPTAMPTPTPAPPTAAPPPTSPPTETPATPTPAAS